MDIILYPTSFYAYSDVLSFDTGFIVYWGSMVEWLVGILDEEYRVKAGKYYTAKSLAAHKYLEEHPGCEYTIGLLVAIARVRKLSKFGDRIKDLEVK